MIKRFEDIKVNESFRERVGQHLTGTREPPKLTLRYTLEVNERVGTERVESNKKEKRPSRKEGSVEFYLTTSDNCREEPPESKDNLGNYSVLS